MTADEIAKGDGYRVMVWRLEGSDWLERLLVRPFNNGWELSGAIVGIGADLPTWQAFDAHYVVGVDSQWRTRSASISVRVADRCQTLRLESDGAGAWTVGGVRAHQIDGCIDVDIAITPSTDTLPIRRLNLAIGEQRTLAAAWVGFPDLVVMGSVQRYTRLAIDRWRYESLGEDGTRQFTADVTVDGDGFVERYGDLWRRVRVESVSAPDRS